MSSFWQEVRKLFGGPPARDRESEDEEIVRKLRAKGVRIGKGCRIYTTHFSTEPYLVSLGDGVSVAGGVKFLTHDGSARMLRARRPGIQCFGPIVVGEETFIGEGAIILPGTTIGPQCVIGAGAVVRGMIPANSLVIGNPGSVVGRASTYLERIAHSENSLDTFHMREDARREAILTHFQLRAAVAPNDT